MMEEDPWDSLLQLEGKAFEDGVQEGTQEARKSAEVREKGIAAGFRHGFAFHMEISFMETITRRMLSDIDSKVAENVSPSVALPGSNKERTRKKCQQLITRIEDIPTNNAQDVDFISLLKELQSIYRSISPHVPSFVVEAEASSKPLDW